MYLMLPDPLYFMFENRLLVSLAHLLVGLFDFLVFNMLYFYGDIMQTLILSNVELANVSPSCALPLHVVISFTVQQLFSSV